MWRRNSHILYGRKKILEDDNFLLTGFKENEGRIVIFDDAIDSFTNNLCPKVSDMINKNNDYLMNIQKELMEKMDAIQVQIKEREGRYQEANREDDPELKASEEISSFYKLYLESISAQIAQEESKIKQLKQQHAFLLAASNQQNSKKMATVVKYFREKLDMYRADSIEKQSQQSSLDQNPAKTCIISNDYPQSGQSQQLYKQLGSLTCRQYQRKHESHTTFVQDYGFNVEKSTYSSNWTSPIYKQLSKDLSADKPEKVCEKSKIPPKNENQSVLDLSNDEDHKKLIIIQNKMRSTFKKVSRSCHYKSKPLGIHQEASMQDQLIQSKIEQTDLTKSRQNTPERQTNKQCFLRDLSFTTPRKKSKQEFDSRIADQVFSKRVLNHWENIQKNQPNATSFSFINFKQLDSVEKQKEFNIKSKQQLLSKQMKIYTSLKKQQNIQPQINNQITLIQNQLETEKERNLLLKKQLQLKTTKINKIYSFLSECILTSKKNIGSKLLQSAARKQLSEIKFINLLKEVDKELQNKQFQRNDLEGHQEKQFISPQMSLIKQWDQTEGIGINDKKQNEVNSEIKQGKQSIQEERMRMRSFNELTMLQILFILLRESHLATQFLAKTAFKKNKAEDILEYIKNDRF